MEKKVEIKFDGKGWQVYQNGVKISKGIGFEFDYDALYWALKTGKIESFEQHVCIID